MGRLDDAAKHKVVELRKAGLSFRKIRAVLELENIKVSAQAIYLFLREFEGRPMVRVKPMDAGSNKPRTQVRAARGPTVENWSNIRIQNLLRQASQHSSFTVASDISKQTPRNSEDTGNSSGESSGGSRSEQQSQGNKEENDIQIVSVTSLAQHQQRVPQSTMTRAGTAPVSSTSALTTSGGVMRKRVTPSPASVSILAARRRLLDKALSHRMKSFHQMASMLRRDQPGMQGADLMSSVAQSQETYNLAAEKTALEGQPGSSNTQRRFLTQRPGLSVRSLHPPPRVGIRLPNRPIAPLTSSAPGVTGIRLQPPGSQGASRSEGNPNQQQAAQDPAGRTSLQDQIQTLGSEMRSLGFAVKMLVEQQCRLEREQAQQTQIQKQILSTLQGLATKIGRCGSVQQQHNKTPSPSALPPSSASTSFSQDNFNFNQSAYSQCSQTQPSFNSLESLENIDAFKLPKLSPASMNGFPPCSNADTHPLTHTPPQTQPYTATYTEHSNQTVMSSYTQSYIPTYNQTLPQNFRPTENKPSDFQNSCAAARTFQDCAVSTHTGMNSNHNLQDQQINIIKVEAP